MPKRTAIYLLNHLRENDPLRYPAILFLPEKKRLATAALYAFNAEIEKIPQRVSEPAAGEIRLAWWRDAVAGEREAEAQANPVAAALLLAIAEHDLPRDGFLRYLAAREFDLYHDPMPDRETLEAYFGETESFLLQMAARINGAGEGRTLADAAGHGGVAYGTAQLCRRLARHRAGGRVYLPADLLAAAGLDPAQWLGAADARHQAALTGLLAFGREHHARARKALTELARPEGLAFLPLAVVKPTLNKVEKMGEAALRAPVELNPLRMQFAYWRAALFGHESGSEA